MYSREYLRVHVRVLTCDSRATREGCQVARERHCKSTSMGLVHMATEMPIEQMEVLQTALKKLIGSASMNELLGERARVKPREAREVAFSRVFAYNHAISRIRAKWREIATRDVIA